MKWKIAASSKQSADRGDIIKILLQNRGLKTKKEIEKFLAPLDPSLLTADRLGIDKKNLDKAFKRIRLAIQNQEATVVYGDYDADGICATAIMWETLHDLGAKALPFIPQREKEGYGISQEGIDTILNDPKYHLTYKSNKTNGLIIAVDSGIVAHEAVEYARGKKLDVIILDHHEKPKKLPKALAIIHTTQLCASGIAYFFAKELTPDRYPLSASLELAAIATVTDLMPLVGLNRSIVKYGLGAINKTQRPGLKAVLEVAGIEKVGTYEIGFMIGPRLNASGRIDSALTALRLLCTRNLASAIAYARLLDETNRQRQLMLEEQTIHAVGVQDRRLKIKDQKEKIIIIENELYHQGIIGLIAGKLVEKYYLPAIVIAKGEKVSKASARSISGFNIIEAIRTQEKSLINAGGHPMAAGFTIETSQIENFKLLISRYAQETIAADQLERSLRVDCELPLKAVTMDLYNSIASFAPFGIANPEPVFASEAKIGSLRTVGADRKHLKLTVTNPYPLTADRSFDAIAFNMGNLVAAQLKVGDTISVAYTLDLNTFNGNSNLQLKVKDIKTENGRSV